MIYIKHTEGKVNYTHYFPFDERLGLGKTKEELKQDGLLVDTVPKPDILEGKNAILMVNTETKEIYYEYVDIPKTEEEIKVDEIAEIKNENAELMFKQVMMDLEIEAIKNDNAELMIRLANLELGGLI